MMADIPTIRSRNMSQLMQSVVDTHQRIRESIREHAQNAENARAALNEKQNANAKLGYKTRTGE